MHPLNQEFVLRPCQLDSFLITSGDVSGMGSGSGSGTETETETECESESESETSVSKLSSLTNEVPKMKGEDENPHMKGLTEVALFN